MIYRRILHKKGFSQIKDGKHRKLSLNKKSSLSALAEDHGLAPGCMS